MKKIFVLLMLTVFPLSLMFGSLTIDDIRAAKEVSEVVVDAVEISSGDTIVKKALTPEQEKENYYRENRVPQEGHSGSRDGCVDTDNGATDNSGYSCAMNGASCYGGSYDDDDFDEMAMCCSCGGGQATTQVELYFCTDGYGGESSFNIIDADGGELYAGGYGAGWIGNYACHSEFVELTDGDYTAVVYDSYGDGGISLGVYDPGQGTFAEVSCAHMGYTSGECGSAAFAVPTSFGCDDASACNDGAAEECVYPADGFDCAGACLNGGDAYAVTVGGGSWASEISWELSGNTGAGSGSYTLCLAGGDHTLNMYDSYGDGWSGNTFNIDAFSFTLSSGAEGSETFCLGGDAYCAALVEGCTDSGAPNYNPDADVDDGTCEFYCNDNQWMCDSGDECITAWYFCDGSSANGNGSWGPDCADGSDESLANCCDIDDSTYPSDCAGTCLGSAVEGCDGVCDSGAVIDGCGVCGGSGTAIDECGVCDGDGSSCQTSDYLVVVGGGSYDSEISWNIDGGSTMSANHPDGAVVALVDGTHTFNGFDSWGDGWNGAGANIYNADGGLIASFVVEGSSGSWDFDTPGTVIIAGCMLDGAPNYDPAATIENGSCEQFPGGPVDYWYGSYYSGWQWGCGLYYVFSPDDLAIAVGDGTCHYYGDVNFDGVADGLACAAFSCDAGDCEDCEGTCLGSVFDDCAGVCGGESALDDCGVCDGGNADMDCAGTCSGDASLDDCGVCGGDSSSCADCAGVPNGDSVIDDCGVCGGDSSLYGTFDVTHIVSLVDAIIDETWSSDDLMCSDINADGTLNIVDIVQIVEVILGNTRLADATAITLINSGNSLELEADGFVGGIELRLSHGENFAINLSDDSMVSAYRTNGTQTVVIIAAPEVGSLFTTSKEFAIEDVTAATSAGELQVTIPMSFGLSAAYPNPFNPSTSIDLNMSSTEMVSVDVYNVMGQLIDTIHSGELTSGVHTFTWNGADISSGVYFIKATSASNVASQKVMLLK